MKSTKQNFAKLRKLIIIISRCAASAKNIQSQTQTAQAWENIQYENSKIQYSQAWLDRIQFARRRRAIFFPPAARNMDLSTPKARKSSMKNADWKISS